MTSQFKLCYVLALLVIAAIGGTSIRVSSVAGLTSNSGAGHRSNKRSAPPNIVFVLADDLGWSELGAYGNRFNETPHLDQLAKRGMRFSGAYAASTVCSPTRASLMTGHHPARIGITNYLEATDEKFLSPSAILLPHQLKRAGYVSGLIGKWHLMGDYAKRRGDSKFHGFAEETGSETKYIGPGDYVHPYFFMPEMAARASGEYLTDRLNREATDFIRRHREQPFFLYLSHYAVHTKLEAKPEIVKKYAAKPGAGTDRNNPVLAAMLESVDQGIGEITRTLDELGLSDNTIIIFTSDNGGEHLVTSNGPLRAGKSTLYEGGIRVPLIISWPGTVRPGLISNVPVITTDFYPTLLELTKVRSDSERATDGVNLLPLLRGSGGLRRRALFWHYPLPKPHFLGGRSAGAMRQGSLKLIQFYDTGTCELYDLEKDPGEQRDLAAENPRQVAELKRQLDDWRKQIGAKPVP